MKNIIRLFLVVAGLFLFCRQTFADFDTNSNPVTYFWPAKGPPGTGIFLLGTNLNHVSAVWFNNLGADFNLTTNKQGALTQPISLPAGAAFIAATVPRFARSGQIYVTTPGGTMPVGFFTVDSPLPLPPPPLINSCWPTNGVAGTSVTISGDNLDGAMTVQFNGVNSTFNVMSNSLLVASVPDQAVSGPIFIFTPGGTNTDGYWFTVDKPAAGRRVISH